MNLDRLLPILRCLNCGGRLSQDGRLLACQRCGERFPLADDIPVMLREDTEDRAWEDYFRRVSEKMGDSEAANSYVSLKNFHFVRNQLLRFIGSVKGQAVLDVGCGTGHFSQSLARDNLLVGVDVSLDMLVYARQKGLAVVQSSGKKLPFEAVSFDLVIANNVIQSIQAGEPFINELSRVTRPGGRLIVSATNGQNLSLVFFRVIEKRKYAHLKTYTAEEIRNYLGAARCHVEAVLFLFFPFGFARHVRANEPPGALNRHLATTLAVEGRKPKE
ncbi:MAG: methyltransferase domain-containing protein [Clostridiales bacterium]|nr:methyltransferase domain-containing protein [Clostridiales bacterium]